MLQVLMNIKQMTDPHVLGCTEVLGDGKGLIII